MKFQLKGARIQGIQLVLPTHEVSFDSEASGYNFSPQQSAKLKTVMGFDRRRVVEDNVTCSDLVVAGFEALFNDGLLDLNSLDALIFVTQTPDYLIPGTSYIVHGRLGLRRDMLCLDINQGCAGFIIGLITAFSLLNQTGIRKVALVNADVASRLVAQSDRNSRPIIGDAASITIIESIQEETIIPGNIMVDGVGWDALMVPAGGMKLRTGPETRIQTADASGNMRSLENLVMKGDAVFNFVMRDVPPMIQSLLHDAGLTFSEVDRFVFHQPNPFMLRKLAEKIGIDYDQMPMDLVRNYGNSSGVSIPAVLCTCFEASYFDESRLMCLAGFGVGLTWGAMLMPMSNLSFLRVLEV
jgi:3-oxoacyl-[acyl-carrier-protein] synthase III